MAACERGQEETMAAVKDRGVGHSPALISAFLSGPIKALRNMEPLCGSSHWARMWLPFFLSVLTSCSQLTLALLVVVLLSADEPLHCHTSFSLLFVHENKPEHFQLSLDSFLLLSWNFCVLDLPLGPDYIVYLFSVKSDFCCHHNGIYNFKPIP